MNKYEKQLRKSLYESWKERQKLLNKIPSLSKKEYKTVDYYSPLIKGDISPVVELTRSKSFYRNHKSEIKTIGVINKTILAKLPKVPNKGSEMLDLGVTKAHLLHPKKKREVRVRNVKSKEKEIEPKSQSCHTIEVHKNNNIGLEKEEKKEVVVDLKGWDIEQDVF